MAILVVNASVGEFETGFSNGGQTREHIILWYINTCINIALI